ncbi:MAG: hypothetical protein JWP95_307, partial [Actinotalea sp.]|nr:hypothetical protein [Actinotalea sp.]
STEHLSIVVNGYYEWLLGRAVDAGGLQGWVQALRSGHRSEEIIAGMVASDEYRAGTSP